MSPLQSLLFALVSFAASIVGAICGIGGGTAGRMLNRRMDNAAADKLLLVLMGIIILIGVYNSIKYLIV